MRKFEDVIPITDWEILTPDGWVNCTKIMKTIPYEKWIIEFDCGTKLECADTHIVILESNSEVFVKDLIIGDIVKSIKGASKVISITNTNEHENMYDVEVDSNSHQYYSNGIVSHNTTTAAAYLLYEAIFNSNKSIGILANKGATSAEILDRLCKMFEELPWFLKPGVVTWNKTSITLANGSKCFSAATSSSSIRGKSVGTLYCVTGDTEIELLVNDLDKITTTISEAFDLLDSKSRITDNKRDGIFIKNVESVFKVLSENNAYRNFKGISKIVRSDIIQLYFDDESVLKLTSDHKVFSNHQWVESKDTQVGDIFITPTGTKNLIYKDKSTIPTFVYDLVGVDTTKNFFASKSLISNCDEFAHIDNDVEFFESTYPVISSGKTTKVIITSTPKGMNLFYKLWIDSEQGRNEFVRSKYLWYDHPERDEEWRQITESNIGTQNFSQEYDCCSANTEVTIKSTNSSCTNITFGDLYQLINNSQPPEYCTRDFEISDNLIYDAAISLAFNSNLVIPIVVNKSSIGYEILNKIIELYNDITSDCMVLKSPLKRRLKKSVESQHGVKIYVERLNKQSFKGRTLHSIIIDSSVIDKVSVYPAVNRLICNVK